MSVVIETTIGDITVDLFLRERPRACQNFLKLCKLKYYNFCLFHTVQRDFIAQTGDPEGTGKGGTSLYGILYGDQAKYFEAEKTPKLKHQNTGTLSFASHGDHMLGSQFFVTLAEDLQYLDGEHCVFGQVVEGLEVLVKFNAAICDDKYLPYQDIRITHTVVLDDPLDDPAGLEIPDRSPQLTDAILNSGRIAADEDLEDSAGRTAEELDELIEEREAQARATILEMVGDLPDAESAPPENVLFVCKLNPVTTDDDLQIIFSRFGKVVGCEIIRDQKTGNSLQYGFIEFDNPKSCENAYFKMDNVLIDDRRIHVDFSQSVSKVQWRGKGRVTYESGTAAGDLANFGGGGGGRGRGRGGRPGGDRGGRPGGDGGRGRGRPDGDGGRGRGRPGGGRGGGLDGDSGRYDRRHGPDRNGADRGDRNGADRRDHRDGRRERAGAEDQLGGLNVGQLKAMLGDGRKKRDDIEGSSDGDKPNKKSGDKQKASPDSEKRFPRKEESRDKRRRSPSPSERSSRKDDSRNKKRRSPSPDVEPSRKQDSRDKGRRSRSPDARPSRKTDSRDKGRRSPSPDARPSRKKDSRDKGRQSPSPDARPSRKADSRDKGRRSPSPDARPSRKTDSRDKGRRSPSPDARPSRKKDSRDKGRQSPSPDAKSSRKTDSRDKGRRSPSPDARPSRKKDSRDKRRRSPSPDARPSRNDDSRDKRRRSPSPDARSAGREARGRRRHSPSPDTRHSKKEAAREISRRSPSSDDERPGHSKDDERPGHSKDKRSKVSDEASRKKKKHKVKKSGGDKRSKKKEKKRRRSTSSESSSSSDSSSDEDRRKHKSKRR